MTKSNQAPEANTVVMNGPSQVAASPVVSPAVSRPKITIENVVLTSEEDEPSHPDEVSNKMSLRTGSCLQFDNSLQFNARIGQ